MYHMSFSGINLLSINYLSSWSKSISINECISGALTAESGENGTFQNTPRHTNMASLDYNSQHLSPQH